MASKSITVVTGLLVLGTVALLTIGSSAAFSQDAGRKDPNPCEQPWPHNAGCKGGVAPADGRRIRLITKNPLSLKNDEPGQRPPAQQPTPSVVALPPVVSQTDPSEEPPDPPAVSLRRNSEPQKPQFEQDTDRQPQAGRGGPAPRILQRAPARPDVADGEPEQRPGRFERPGRLELRERAERYEQPERFERGRGVERPERYEQPERFERPERAERNRPKAPERFERGPRYNDKAAADEEGPRDDSRPVRRAPVAGNDDAPRRERRWCMRNGREFPCPF